jgi:hypothetical protein
VRSGRETLHEAPDPNPACAGETGAPPGVLAAHASWRNEVIPRPVERPRRPKLTKTPKHDPRPGWADRLVRVFAVVGLPVRLWAHGGAPEHRDPTAGDDPRPHRARAGDRGDRATCRGVTGEVRAA